MRFLNRLTIAAVLGFALAATAFVAQADTTPLVLKSFTNSAAGADRVFGMDIQNNAPQDVIVHGRLVAISVYDATPAVVMSIPNATIKAGETKRFVTRWTDAPFVGRVRTLLVITDGKDPSLVASSDFWILPIKETAVFFGVLLFLIVLVLVLMRLPVYLKERVPDNMTPYRVEPGDSVVSISVRYNVTWQDIVKANKLKPPYDLKPGKRIFIPRHALQHPKEESSTQTKA